MRCHSGSWGLWRVGESTLAEPESDIAFQLISQNLNLVLPILKAHPERHRAARPGKPFLRYCTRSGFRVQ